MPELLLALWLGWTQAAPAPQPPAWTPTLAPAIVLDAEVASEDMESDADDVTELDWVAVAGDARFTKAPKAKVAEPSAPVPVLAPASRSSRP